MYGNNAYKKMNQYKKKEVLDAGIKLRPHQHHHVLTREYQNKLLLLLVKVPMDHPVLS